MGSNLCYLHVGLHWRTSDLLPTTRLWRDASLTLRRVFDVFFTVMTTTRSQNRLLILTVLAVSAEAEAAATSDRRRVQEGSRIFWPTTYQRN